MIQVESYQPIEVKQICVLCEKRVSDADCVTTINGIHVCKGCTERPREETELQQCECGEWQFDDERHFVITERWYNDDYGSECDGIFECDACGRSL